MNVSEALPAKRPYKSPQVFDYGDIYEITRAVGNAGAGDGGAGNNKKTH